MSEEGTGCRGWALARRVRRVSARLGSILASATRWSLAAIGRDRDAREDALVAELDRLGGLFKKIGQHFSSRPDLVGSSLARKLERLQDGRALGGASSSVDEAFQTKVLRRVQDELARASQLWWEATEDEGSGEEGDLRAQGMAPFASFEETPVARGSVAQVYRAHLSAVPGMPPVRVAVKVLVPGAKKAFEADAAILSCAARLCDVGKKLVPRRWARVPWEEAQGILLRFSEALVAQTDLIEEGKNLCRVLENFGPSDPDARAPVPILALSSSRMLVMEWIDGEPLDKAMTRLDETRRREVAEKYLRAVEKMVLRDGLLHGDLHPGNVLLGQDGRLALLDVGITIRLTEEMRESCWKSANRYLRKDWAGCAELMYSESPSTPYDRPEEGRLKRKTLEKQLSLVNDGEWRGLVEFWSRLMGAFEIAGVATDRAFDAMGVAVLGAESLARHLPEGETALTDHLAALRKDPDLLSAVLRRPQL